MDDRADRRVRGPVADGTAAIGHDCQKAECQADALLHGPQSLLQVLTRANPQVLESCYFLKSNKSYLQWEACNEHNTRKRPSCPGPGST